MQSGTVIQFLKALGCHDASVQGHWVTCKCPLAPFTHKTGKDSTPSFGVRLDSGLFNCFACQKGTLDALIGTLTFYVQKPGTPEHLSARYNFALAREILQGAAGEVDTLPPYEEALASKVQVFEEWPMWWLSQYMPAHLNLESSNYLESRGLDVLECQREDIRYDTKYKMLVFPYRNAWGALAGARGRCIDPTRKLQHYDYSLHDANNAKTTFMGEQVLPEAVAAHRPVLLVEGQMDRIACLRTYPFTLANLTAKPTPEKLGTLNACPDGVILMLDNDKPGVEATQEWTRQLTCPVGVLEYPKHWKDPDKVPRPELRDLLLPLLD